MQIAINYSPFEYQRQFHSCDTRFKIVVGGRRVGKSYSMLHEIVRHCLTTPDAVAWWVSPTYAEAREVGYETLKLHTELEPAMQYKNDSQLKVKFINGATLYFKSSDNDKSLRGRGLTYLIIDEAAFIKDETVWKKVLRPALSDKQGQAILISSPNGRNWFYQQYLDAQEEKHHNGKLTWSHYRWPTHINPMIPEEEIAIAKSELSDNDFRQEYLAEFVTPAGMVYNNFGDRNIVSEFNVTNYHEIYVGADFGFANPSAIVFMAYCRATGTVTQFDEIYESRMSMTTLVQKIRQVEAKWGVRVERIYTDPAGNAAELTSGISPVDFLRMHGDYIVMNKGTMIAPGIAQVRAWIKAADGTTKFFVYNKCIETIRSIYGYSYEFKKNKAVIDEEPDKDGINDHICDAIRYFFVNRFDSAKYVAKSIQQTDMYNKHRAGVFFKRCNNCNQMFMSKTQKTEPPFNCVKCKEKN